MRKPTKTPDQLYLTLANMSENSHTMRLNVLKQLEHWRMITRYEHLNVHSSDEEIRDVINYLVKHNIIDPTEMLVNVFKTRYLIS